MFSIDLRIILTSCFYVFVLISATCAQELPTPETAIGPVAYQEEFVEPLRPSSLRDGGDLVEDSAPEGGMLVGVEIYSRAGFRRRHTGFRSIYQVGKSLSRGQLIGRESRDSTNLMAKPGFVVGGLKSEIFADHIEGIQLIYYQWDGGNLLRGSRYESEVVGELRRRSDFDFDPAKPIVGVHAYVDRFEPFPDEPAGGEVHINGLMLQVLDLEKMQLAAAKPTPIPAVNQPANAARHELVLDRKNHGEAYYRSEAPVSGILIGFHVHDLERRSSTSRSVRLDPIYQIEDRYQAGEPSHPLGETQSRIVRAKPGFAVCGVHFTNGILDGIKFAELNPKTLRFRSPYDEKLFDFTDDRVEPVEREWMCGGPIFGIEYQYSRVGINAIAFKTDPKTRTRGKANNKREPQLNSRGYPIGASPVTRTWTSDRGKQVLGTLVSFDEDRVRIRKEGGKPFTLPLAKYSAADQEFLTQLPQLQD